MGHFYYPPPPPFLGGRQPYAPPVRGQPAQLAGVAPPLGGGTPTNNSRLHAIRGAWEPPPPMPFIGALQPGVQNERSHPNSLSGSPPPMGAWHRIRAERMQVIRIAHEPIPPPPFQGWLQPLAERPAINPNDLAGNPPPLGELPLQALYARMRALWEAPPPLLPVLGAHSDPSLFTPPSGGQVTVDWLLFAEILDGVNVDALSSAEQLDALSTDFLLPLDAGSTIRLDALPLAEWRASLSIDLTGPAEWCLTVLQNAIVPADAGLLVPGSQTIAIESLASSQQTATLGAEQLDTVSVDSTGAQASGISLIGSYASVLETLAAARLDAPLPAEWLGVAQLILDNLAPVEWRSTIQADATGALDARATLLRDAFMASDSQASQQGVVPAAGEWSAGRAVDTAGSAEVLRAAQRDSSAPLDALASAQRNLEMPADWSTLRTVDLLSPIFGLATPLATLSGGAEWRSGLLADAGSVSEWRMPTLAEVTLPVEWGITTHQILSESGFTLEFTSLRAVSVPFTVEWMDAHLSERKLKGAAAAAPRRGPARHIRTAPSGTTKGGAARAPRLPRR